MATEALGHVRTVKAFASEPLEKARYDEAYAIYRETYERLKPLYPRLSALGEEA